MLMSLLADNFIKLEWVSNKLLRYVNLPSDFQVLLLHGMSEKSVILHEEITSSQADTESVVGSARTHFAISINLHVPLKRNVLCIWARRIQAEFRKSLLLKIMAKLMKMRVGRQTSRVKMSKFFVVVLRWWSPGLSSRISFPQRLSEEEDWMDRLCLRVLLTPLELRNVSFQIFIPH